MTILNHFPNYDNSEPLPKEGEDDSKEYKGDSVSVPTNNDFIVVY